MYEMKFIGTAISENCECSRACFRGRLDRITIDNKNNHRAIGWIEVDGKKFDIYTLVTTNCNEITLAGTLYPESKYGKDQLFYVSMREEKLRDKIVVEGFAFADGKHYKIYADFYVKGLNDDYDRIRV